MMEKGFVAFISLLVISAVALAISVSVALMGVNSSRSSLDYKKGEEVKAITKGCLEHALINLRDSDNYTGGNYSIGDGGCDILVTGTGSSKTIDITSTISNPPDYVSKIQAVAKKAGNSVNILSIEEVE